MYSTEFSLNALQISLWSTNNPEEFYNSSEEESVKKENKGEEGSNIDVQFIDLKLIGECFMSFNKLFREDFHAVFISFYKKINI